MNVQAGTLLRQARERAGMTQAELADRLGCTQPAISQAEASDASLTVATLQRFADALGCDIELALKDQASLGPPESLIPISPEVVATGRRVMDLPCTNPALSPTLDVVGFPLTDGQFGGWYLRVTDPFGTVVWSVMLKGMEPDLPPPVHGLPE